MCAAGEFNRFGFPRPVAGARLVRDFGDEGHATRPPLAVQKALAAARPARRRGHAPATSSSTSGTSRRRPRPSSRRSPTRGPTPSGGGRCTSTSTPTARPSWARSPASTSRAASPTTCTRARAVVALDAPRTVTADVDGDLRGRGTWTLTPTATGTHVRFDWQVHADRRLLRALTPVLRPVFRWNHNWAIARAMEGLEPYARRAADRGPLSGRTSPRSPRRTWRRSACA